jgi:hypothetical protein
LETVSSRDPAAQRQGIRNIAPKILKRGEAVEPASILQSR